MQCPSALLRFSLAVVKTREMLESAYADVCSAIGNEWSIVVGGSRDCGCHGEGRCCSPSFCAVRAGHFLSGPFGSVSA